MSKIGFSKKFYPLYYAIVFVCWSRNRGWPTNCLMFQCTWLKCWMIFSLYLDVCVLTYRRTILKDLNDCITMYSAADAWAPFCSLFGFLAGFPQLKFLFFFMALSTFHSLDFSLVYFDLIILIHFKTTEKYYDGSLNIH